MSSSVGLFAFVQEGDIFRICVVLVRFFLDFLKDIVTAKLFFSFSSPTVKHY